MNPLLEPVLNQNNSVDALTPGIRFGVALPFRLFPIVSLKYLYNYDVNKTITETFIRLKFHSPVRLHNAE
jgi:hypothetical protein